MKGLFWDGRFLGVPKTPNPWKMPVLMSTPCPRSCKGENFTSFPSVGRIGRYIPVGLVTSRFSGTVPTFLELTEVSS